MGPGGLERNHGAAILAGFGMPCPFSLLSFVKQPTRASVRPENLARHAARTHPQTTAAVVSLRPRKICHGQRSSCPPDGPVAASRGLVGQSRANLMLSLR
jgi:hypothetical protein